MSRPKVSVKSVIWDLARSCGEEPDTSINTSGLTAAQKAQFLRCVNTAYQFAYTLAEWEDAWADATVTPTSGVIAYSDIGNAARFTLWSADPRPQTSQAYPIRSITSADGIQVQSSAGSVFALYLPKVDAFTDADSTDLVILDSLAAATVLLARAEYLRTSGQYETAAFYEQRGRDALEQRWSIEFQRVARAWWLRPQT